MVIFLWMRDTTLIALEPEFPARINRKNNIIESAQVAIERAKLGKPASNHILLGLIGVGNSPSCRV